MGYLKKLLEYIHEPKKFAFFVLSHGVGNFLQDSIYLKILYWLRVGRKLNLEQPTGCNEKLQWLKLHEHFPERTHYVDKYEVRDYIAKKIGSDYLIPLLGVWDCYSDIDFNQLPDQFVLKCTHDSGGVMVCKDKSKINHAEKKRFFTRRLKQNFYKVGREYPYKHVKPRIIAEKYMKEDGVGSLRDYKLMCFHGKVKCSFVCTNRAAKSGLCVNFYDRDWQPMPFERHYPRNPIETPKPQQYDLMVELAENLAADFIFVRIDFYEIDGKVYFGEITFYPGSGMEEFTPYEADELLGSWIELP